MTLVDCECSLFTKVNRFRMPAPSPKDKRHMYLLWLWFRSDLIQLMTETLSGVYTNLPIDFPGGSDSKASAYNVGDLGSIPGLEDLLEKEIATHSSIRIFSRQDLENLMDRRTW